MRHSVAALAVLCLLGACDGNPLEGEEDPVEEPTDEEPTDEEPDVETNENGIPLSLANNLSGIEVSADGQTVAVSIAGLDGTPIATTYAFDAAATNGLPAGVFAYTKQEDPIDRFYTALVKESTDGTARAGVASDGGQFNRFFWGGTYERDGDFDPPSIGDGPGEGQVTYAGDYAGLDNYSGPVPPQNTDPIVQPQAPGRVVGDVLFNVNFDEMLINGAIFNREAIDNGTELADVVLIVTDIDENGEFLGNIEYADQTDANGQYGGIFGGVDAASLAGVAAFIPVPGSETSWETGMFVLTQCGMTGEDAVLCEEAAP